VSLGRIQLERTLASNIEDVFRAWTEPEILVKWFHASENVTIQRANIDLRIGGSYCLTMQDHGHVCTITGTYLTIQAPNILEFTWQWDDKSKDPEQTIVKVELSSCMVGTFLRITHKNLSSERSVKEHLWGWEGVLKALGEATKNSIPKEDLGEDHEMDETPK